MPNNSPRISYTLTRQNAIRPRNQVPIMAMLRSSNTMTPPGRAPRRSPIHRQPRFNNNTQTNNKAAKKIQAALRGWLARQKHLPKNKFRTVVNPNGTILVAIKPTRLGASVAKKSANMKQHNAYISRLRGL